MKPLQVNERPERQGLLEPPGATAIGQSCGTGAESGNSLSEAVAITRRAILSSMDRPSLQAALISHLRRSCGLVLAAWYHSTGAQIGQNDCLEGLLCPADGISAALRQKLKDAAVAAIRGEELQSFGYADGSSLQMLALPIPGSSGECLLAVVEERSFAKGQPSQAITVCHLLGSFITEQSLLRSQARATHSAHLTAALIELVGRMQSAADSISACQRLADALQLHLHADEIIVGLCRNGTAECRMTAVSGGQVIDRFSQRTQLIESVLQESAVRSAGAIWPVQDAANRHALLSHQQLSRSDSDTTLVSMPLQAETGLIVGSILAVFSKASVHSPSDQQEVSIEGRAADAERFLRAGAAPLASCLGLLQNLTDSRWLRWTQSIRKCFTASKLNPAAWVSGAIVLILLLPITYPVHTTSELQPVERRYVAAPFDGPLAECLVEPGDVVQKDQLLARMDGREIRWELAEVQASVNKAIKERNTQVSGREFGSAAITGHEIQRLEQRSELLTFRATSLEIRSPADGVVVSGDHREAEGVPLKTGQTLFEIAPLDAMVAEICIPEDDVRHVFEGMAVTIQLEAVPEDALDSAIRCVHPRAELRDGKNVFVAEADIGNPDGLLRPGMRGHARIQTRRHTLGWNLFHKPAAWFLGWLGW